MNSRFEDTYFKQKPVLRYKDKLIHFERPLIMSILNLTDDSFYAGSRIVQEKDFLVKAEAHLRSGADILDVGAMSSRPGAILLSESEELRKIIPAVERLQKEFPHAMISVDTFRSKVADEALQNGAGIINDISGFQIDPDLPDVIANHRATYVLMHMKGTFETMHELVCGEDVFQEVSHYFFSKIAYLKSRGVQDVILDPGFGFSKTMEQNFMLLKHMHLFHHLNAPILIGISRKSMIYKNLNCSPEEALAGTLTLNSAALLKGASILRVHDTKETSDVIRMIQLLG